MCRIHGIERINNRTYNSLCRALFCSQKCAAIFKNHSESIVVWKQISVASYPKSPLSLRLHCPLQISQQQFEVPTKTVPEGNVDRRHNAKIRWHRWAILDLQAVPSDRPVAGNAFKWVTTSTGCRLQPKYNDRYLRKISRFSYESSSRTLVQRV